MAFVLLVFGAAFMMAGFHGNAGAFFHRIGNEFTGSPSFGKWTIAILAIGAIGYIKPIKPVSDAFLVLVLIVLFLSNKGFFAKFSQQFGLTGNSTLLSPSNPPTGSFSINSPGANFPNFITVGGNNG